MIATRWRSPRIVRYRLRLTLMALAAGAVMFVVALGERGTLSRSVTLATVPAFVGVLWGLFRWAKRDRAPLRRHAELFLLVSTVAGGVAAALALSLVDGAASVVLLWFVLIAVFFGVASRIVSRPTAPGRIALEHAELLRARAFDAAWELLTPPHRASIPVELSASCLGRHRAWDRSEYFGEYDVPLDVEPFGLLRARLVFVRLRSGRRVLGSFAYHLHRDGTSWQIVATPEALQAYRRGVCPPLQLD